MPALGQHQEYGCQPFQIQEPAHQIGLVSDLQQTSTAKPAEAMPAFRFAPQFFDLLPRPLREAVADRPTQPSHPLMHGLSSGRLGGNVRPDPPPHEGGQERLGKILSFPSNFVFQGSCTIAVHKETKMFKIPKQAHTAEFKEQAVKHVTAVGSMSRVAEDLGLVEQTLRNWVKAAKAGTLNPVGVNAITPEQMARSRVRAEVSRLRMEGEILQKATAYFARDAQ